MLVTPPLTDLTELKLKRRERRAVDLQGFAARQDGSTAVVKVTDLSYDGCGIETTAVLRPGERIELRVLNRGALSAVVRWCAKGQAGLAFEAAPEAQKQRSSRRSERIALTAEVGLRHSGRSNYRVRVLDLSPDGCRIELVERPNVDDHVWIKFDGIEALEAKVCWIADFKAGVRYTKPIHPAVFDLLLARFRGEAR